MAKKKSHDFSLLALAVVQAATGERLLPIEEKAKKPLVNARAQRGGLIGGKARMSGLSAEQRSELARKAALTRWRKPPTEAGGNFNETG